MKIKIHPAGVILLAAIAAGLASLTGTGCSRHDRTDVSQRVKDAYASAKNSMTDAWKNVKSYSFEKRDDFSANANALTSKMDSQMQQMRANFSEAKASASRKAAMDELKNSEADYKATVAALSHATADTWDSAKQSVMASWDRLQAAYDKARKDD